MFSAVPGTKLFIIHVLTGVCERTNRTLTSSRQSELLKGNQSYQDSGRQRTEKPFSY